MHIVIVGMIESLLEMHIINLLLCTYQEFIKQ